MNFSNLAKQLQLQAEKASEAARNFKGFDEMAAQDTYIRSDSLNVKSKQHNNNLSNQQQQMETQNGSALTQLALPTGSTAAPFSSSTSPSAPLETFYSDVKASQRDQIRKSRQTVDIEHQFSSSDEEYDEDDPILQQVTKEQKAEKRARKTHRFMNELDDRIAKENVAISLPMPNVDDNKKLEEPQSQVTSWLSTVLDRKKPNPKRQTEMAPLARKKPSAPATNNQHDHGSDDYNVVVSSSVLQADELAELKQLKSATPGWPQKLFMLMQDHPREAFIALTLLGSIFAYFYTNMMHNMAN